MAKYRRWTISETRAILKMIGGVEIARQVLRGERKLRVNKNLNRKPAIEPLVGTVVKTLLLKPSKIGSVKEAIKLGGYTGHRHSEMAEMFKFEEVGLIEAVKVELVRFNRTSYSREILAWAQEEGEKEPILAKHLFEIGIQYPEEQLNAKIFALGSGKHPFRHILYLDGYLPGSSWRDLANYDFNDYFNQYWLFGFIS